MSTITDAAAVVAAVTPLARIISDVAEGRMTDKAEIAKSLVNAALDQVPEEELHGYLTDAGRSRAEVAFEIARAAKAAEPLK